MIWYSCIITKRTSRCLVNIHHPSELQYFFLVMCTFNIYFLCNVRLCNTVLLTIVSMLRVASPWLIYFKARSLYLLGPLPILPIPQLAPQATINLFSVSIRLFVFLDPTYMWDHTVFILLCLTYFTWHYILKVHPCLCKWQDCLLFYYL